MIQKRVGIWIRVSTDFQVKDDSPEHHEQRARYYTQAKDWEVVEVYQLGSFSGKTVMDHPETKRMVKDIRSGHISCLIFSKLARLVRNTRELLDLAKIFRSEQTIAHLKWSNIQDDFIVYHRAKTERALRSDPKPITVFLSEDLLRIIAKWCSSKNSPNDYLFPILEIGMSTLDQHFKAIGLTKFVNDGLAIVSKELRLNRKVTTIFSRHTFSTQMKRAGASTEFIQEALGHTDKKTTENYLDSFENDLKRDFAQKLNSFKTII